MSEMNEKMVYRTPNPVGEETIPDQKEILKKVYDALREKGYNPIVQIVGYLLSEDPAYITNCNNARALIRKIDRDEILNEMVRCYLGVGQAEEKP